MEGVHHRHLVKEARENIRREITQNIEVAKKDEVSVQDDADNMKVNIEKARLLRDKPNDFKQNKMHFNFSWDSFNDSAWRAARDSGALTFMPTAEVQLYADSYNQQDIVNQQAVAIFSSQTDGAAPLFMEKDPKEMHSEDSRALMHDSALSYIRLHTLKQLIEGLDKNYADTLKK